MELKICVGFFTLLAYVYGQDPCVQQALESGEFMQCSQDLAAIFTSRSENGYMANNPMELLCEPEARSAMMCIFRFQEQCPALAAMGGGGTGGLNVTEIQMQGGLDIVCEMFTGECMELQGCLASFMGPDLQGTALKKTAASMDPTPGRTPFTLIVEEISPLCGSMRTAITCLANAKEACPNTVRKLEQTLHSMSDQTGRKSPSFTDAKAFVINYCRNSEEFQQKKICLKERVDEDSFVSCYDSVKIYNSNNQEGTCDVYFSIKKCLEAALEMKCGPAATNMLIAASPLFIAGMPNNCEDAAGYASTLHASLITVVITAALVFCI